MGRFLNFHVWVLYIRTHSIYLVLVLNQTLACGLFKCHWSTTFTLTINSLFDHLLQTLVVLTLSLSLLLFCFTLYFFFLIVSQDYAIVFVLFFLGRGPAYLPTSSRAEQHGPFKDQSEWDTKKKEGIWRGGITESKFPQMILWRSKAMPALERNATSTNTSNGANWILVPTNLIMTHMRTHLLPL